MTKDEQDIRATESALYAAMVAKDFAALDRLLSAETVFVHSTGKIETKVQYLEALGQGAYIYEGFTSRDPVVTVSGDMAMLCGLLDMAAAGGGVRRVMHLYVALVFVRCDARWQLRLRQATRLPD